jgi:RimJ/RimL family protein N-acetyltransferase
MTAIPTLETERLILRAPKLEDFPPFEAHATSPRAVFEDGPLNRTAAWKEFATAAAGWMLRGYGSLSIEDRASGAYLGEVGIYCLATYPEPEIGWMLVPEAEGRGIAHEAALALRAWAYRSFGWTTLVSYIDAANARSIRLAERLGARLDPAGPFPDEDECVVYRHPGPEALG